MSAALDELDAVISSGMAPAAAVALCAEEYDFRPEVIELRAVKVLGDLATLHDRNQKRADAQKREHKAETAIDAYLSDEPDESFPVWFENRVGRIATKEESDEFQTRYLQHLVRNLKFEI